MTFEEWEETVAAALDAEEAKFDEPPLADAIGYRPSASRQVYEPLTEAEDWAGLKQTADAELTARRGELDQLLQEAQSLDQLHGQVGGHSQFITPGMLPIETGPTGTSFPHN